MKHNKLFKKMFFMTLGLAFTILLVQFVFQYFWLDDFYRYSKKQQISRQLDAVEQVVIDEDNDHQRVESSIRKEMMAGDAVISVFNRFGEPYYGGFYNSSYYLTLLSEDKTVYQVNLSAYDTTEELLEKLAVGKEIRVKGYATFDFNNEIFPEWITIDGKDYGVPVDMVDLETGMYEIKEAEILTEAMDADLLPDIISTNKEDGTHSDEEGTGDGQVGMSDIYLLDSPEVYLGTISYANIDSAAGEGFDYKQGKLFDEQFRVFSEDKAAIRTLNEKGYVSYETMDTYTGINNLVAIKKTTDLYGETLYIFSIMSLESVDETIDIMQSYYFITVIGAIVLAILFSYAYSRKLAKPLLHLNEVTAKLADIDFSTKCDVHTNDEIEDLANNINVMSEQLEKTLQQLKQFLADASHELKTPLTVMKGIVEGMMDGVYDVNDPAHYQRIRSEINDMSQLVYDLLELSKLESGEVNFKEEVFQLSDSVLKCHGKFAPLVKDKDLTVSLSLEEYFVKGNEAYIETVVRNLYANAIQYTQVGGLVDIRMGEKDGHCVLTVENTPSHISEEALEKLWQPFFRVEQSRNRALGGTGLGLYMVKEIMEKHGQGYGIANTDKGVCAYVQLAIESLEIYED